MIFRILDFALAAFFILLSLYTSYQHRTKGVYSDRIVADVILAAIVSSLLAVACGLPINEGIFLITAKLLFFMGCF